jgi:hypothetical protein
MEAAELGALMLSTCSFGTLLYSNDSPISHLDLSTSLRMLLMGIAVAITTFLIIRSPFGRRSGVHFNPAITLTYLWLRRVHRWDAAWYILAQFAGGVAGVLAARESLGMRLSAAPGHGARESWKPRSICQGILFSRASDGHRTLCVEPPTLGSLHSVAGGAAYDLLLHILFFHFRIQRQSGTKLFVSPEPEHVSSAALGWTVFSSPDLHFTRPGNRNPAEFSTSIT